MSIYVSFIKDGKEVNKLEADYSQFEETHQFTKHVFDTFKVDESDREIYCLLAKKYGFVMSNY